MARIITFVTAFILVGIVAQRAALVESTRDPVATINHLETTPTPMRDGGPAATRDTRAAAFGESAVGQAEEEEAAAGPVLTIEFDDLGIRIASYLAGDDTVEPPAIDEWVTWLELHAVDQHSLEGTRNRLRMVPTDVLAEVLQRAIGEQTDNPYALQLLWGPFLRLRGMSLDDVAARLRDHLGLDPIETTWRPTRCSAAQFEHGDRASGQEVDPQEVIEDVLADIAASGPYSVRSAVALMVAEGGSIRFAPDELRTADVVAMRRGPNLIVGSAWVGAAIRGSDGVHANLAHELGGHLFYGRPLSCLIAVHALEAADEVEGLTSFQDLFLTYGYPEAEIYAELKELPFRTSASVGDLPTKDIPVMVDAVADAFPTDVAALLFDWLEFRFGRDATLTDDARAYFRSQVERVAHS